MGKQRKRARVVLLVTGVLAVVLVAVVAWDELGAIPIPGSDFGSGLHRLQRRVD